MITFVSWTPQLIAASIIAGLLLALSLFALYALRRLRLGLQQAQGERAYHAQWLSERLHDQERVILRGQGELRDQLNEKIIKGALAQQRSLHSMQQLLAERTDKLHRGIERRYGEMQQRQTEDAGRLRVDLLAQFEALQKRVMEDLANLRISQQEGLAGHREGFDKRQLEALQTQQETLRTGMTEVRKQVAEALAQHADSLGKRVEGLTESTDQRLKEISGQVEKRLNEGFEKTTETFTQVLTHLTRIDEAQKKITELSSNVVSLQEVLSDKRSRGAFGEVQLSALVRNVMPESGFALQHTLSNGRRADCVLFLPEPTGNVVIDAKFPLESFQRLQDHELPETEVAKVRRQFRADIRRHIDDIAERYIIPGETSDGAVMFLPAEAVFAEIHAHYPDLVEEAFRRRVWLVSPTTMMAILTTARAVLKDAATREQVHIIQQHLRELSKDFGRFQSRMEKLATHISQAHSDVANVNISARKISSRFEQIEQVELEEPPRKELPIFEAKALSDDQS